MRTIGASLQTRLSSGTHSLCHILTITRKDGTVLRFTDLDQDLEVSGNTYESTNSLAVSAITTSANNGIQSTNCSVIFDSAGITEEDVIRGLYDNAQVLFQVVDWQYPAYGVITLLTGTLSVFEVTDKLSGVFECRGLLTRGDTRIGEYYSAECRADLGDARCGVDTASFKTTGTVVSSTSANKLIATLASDPADGYYSLGVLTWLTGDNAGLSMEVLSQVASGLNDYFILSLSMPYTIAAGDTFEVVAGCDRRRTTCINKFNNITNYRGEPFAPLNDFPTDFQKI